MIYFSEIGYLQASTGILTEDGERRVVLKVQGGAEVVVARGNVKYSVASSLSMMPEGIEGILEPGELADLFAFLSYDRHPSDPRARPIPGAPESRRQPRHPADEGR